HALQFIQGIAKIRVAGAESRAFASWARNFVQARDRSIRTRQASIILAALQAAAPLVGWCLIVSLAAGDKTIYGKPAELLAFSASFQFLLGAALQTGGLFLACAQVSVLVDRIRPILTAQPETRGGESDPGRLNGRIEVRDLAFRYDATGPAVLRGISF